LEVRSSSGAAGVDPPVMRQIIDLAESNPARTPEGGRFSGSFGPSGAQGHRTITGCDIAL